MKKGFDFNGVVDVGFARPDITSVIITGNTHIKGVLDWLSNEGIQCAVYFAPVNVKTPIATAFFKANTINTLKLDEFYEDDPVQWEIIKESCPDCRVYKV